MFRQIYKRVSPLKLNTNNWIANIKPLNWLLPIGFSKKKKKLFYDNYLIVIDRIIVGKKDCHGWQSLYNSLLL